ncbi:hypothetical protein Bca4012_018380 [Brassica carinata]
MSTGSRIKESDGWTRVYISPISTTHLHRLDLTDSVSTTVGTIASSNLRSSIPAEPPSKPSLFFRLFLPVRELNLSTRSHPTNLNHHR